MQKNQKLISSAYLIRFHSRKEDGRSSGGGIPTSIPHLTANLRVLFSFLYPEFLTSPSSTASACIGKPHLCPSVGGVTSLSFFFVSSLLQLALAGALPSLPPHSCAGSLRNGEMRLNLVHGGAGRLSYPGESSHL